MPRLLAKRRSPTLRPALPCRRVPCPAPIPYLSGPTVDRAGVSSRPTPHPKVHPGVRGVVPVGLPALPPADARDHPWKISVRRRHGATDGLGTGQGTSEEARGGGGGGSRVTGAPGVVTGNARQDRAWRWAYRRQTAPRQLSAMSSQTISQSTESRSRCISFSTGVWPHSTFQTDVDLSAHPSPEPPEAADGCTMIVRSQQPPRPCSCRSCLLLWPCPCGPHGVAPLPYSLHPPRGHSGGGHRPVPTDVPDPGPQQH